MFVMNKGTSTGGETNTTVLQNQTGGSVTNVNVTEVQVNETQTQG